MVRLYRRYRWRVRLFVLKRFAYLMRVELGAMVRAMDARAGEIFEADLQRARSWGPPISAEDKMAEVNRWLIEDKKRIDDELMSAE